MERGDVKQGNGGYHERWERDIESQMGMAS
jgi:hypothetical protein